MGGDTHALFRKALNAYLEQLSSGSIEPVERYLPYDHSALHLGKLNHIAGEIIKDELRELTNLLNRWHGSLRRWHAWNLVTRSHDMRAAWDLRQEFVEPLAHYCLLSPSSIRDIFTSVATNSFHQVRMAGDPAYKDFLDGDPTPGDLKPKHLTRRKKEERLKKLIRIWPESAFFLYLQHRLDDKPYRDETANYRNLASHFIAPRIALGLTRAVSRQVVLATKLEAQPNGRYEAVPVQGKMVVSYGFGGTEPLDEEIARCGNLAQYRKARSCFFAYVALLQVQIGKL